MTGGEACTIENLILDIYWYSSCIRILAVYFCAEKDAISCVPPVRTTPSIGTILMDQYNT